MGARATIRAVAAGVALTLLGAAAGWAPLFPAAAIAVLVTLVLAGESLIALRARAASAPAARLVAAARGADRHLRADRRPPARRRGERVLRSGADRAEFVLRELQHVADAPIR